MPNEVTGTGPVTTDLKLQACRPVPPNPSRRNPTFTVGARSPVLGPYSSVREVWAVCRPQAAAAARSLLCAATIMHSAGARSKRLAGGEINARLRLVVAGHFRAEDCVPGQIIAPRDVDHQCRYFRSSTARARNFLRSRASAPGTSLHASSRCQASVELVQHVVRADCSKPKRGRNSSRLRRCSTSSLAKRNAAGADLLHRPADIRPARRRRRRASRDRTPSGFEDPFGFPGEPMFASRPRSRTRQKTSPERRS